MTPEEKQKRVQELRQELIENHTPSEVKCWRDFLELRRGYEEGRESAS